MIEYRGYRLLPEPGEGTGTDQIKRPDGSWRYSPPTIAGGPWDWVIARQSEGGEWGRIAVAATEVEARRKVDELIASS
ncbi:MAG TPA: hypothetical protein VFE78_24770 [Gemmataceae bacterium]|nr:hypothetical protein [Gemmataceae bacterium]